MTDKRQLPLSGGKRVSHRVEAWNLSCKLLALLSRRMRIIE